MSGGRGWGVCIESAVWISEWMMASGSDGGDDDDGGVVGDRAFLQSSFLSPPCAFTHLSLSIRLRSLPLAG